MINLGNIIKSLRLQKNWSQDDLAKRIGVKKSSVSAYENDLRLPSFLNHSSCSFSIESLDYQTNLSSFFSLWSFTIIYFGFLPHQTLDFYHT